MLCYWSINWSVFYMTVLPDLFEVTKNSLHFLLNHQSVNFLLDDRLLLHMFAMYCVLIKIIGWSASAVSVGHRGVICDLDPSLI